MDELRVFTVTNNIPHILLSMIPWITTLHPQHISPKPDYIKIEVEEFCGLTVYYDGAVMYDNHRNDHATICIPGGDPSKLKLTIYNQCVTINEDYVTGKYVHEFSLHGGMLPDAFCDDHYNIRYENDIDTPNHHRIKINGVNVTTGAETCLITGHGPTYDDAFTQCKNKLNTMMDQLCTEHNRVIPDKDK